MNDFRLSKGVRPRRYELRFELDLEAWRFTGRGRIAVRLDRAAREITLHALEIRIGRAGVDGGPGATEIAYDTDSQTATLRFAEDLPPGEHALALEWSGEIRETLRGLYRSTRPGERYAATQFEAADARRAFPCFDEPEFKARFALELVHDRSLTAVANAPIAASEDLPDGRRHTRFAETPPISTYLFAFTVGPYDATPEARTRTGVPVRVWLPRGMAQRGIYARDAHVSSLEWLEEYTAIPYAYTKVDAIGIPDFEAGAMENPGAITYRTRLLDADRDTATTATLKSVFSVAAHELTHMWWGDLVTMAWWNDLWLNESFASFVGEKCTAELNPEWRYWRDFVAENARAFSLDALASTHPVSMEARNADEASERFDAVTYEKGSAVLRMIENFIGEDEFREGVRIYLRRFRERNATADDFWTALGEASGRDVTSLANAWIREPGHPLVSCAARQVVGGLEVDLRQERFYTDPDLAAGDQTWPVPMVLTYGTPEGVRHARYLLDSREGTVALPGAAWYFPNGGGTGFYRTALDDRSVELLARGVRDLSAEERLALIDGQWALARARKASIGQFFELVAALRDEDDRAVLAAIAEVLTWISVHAVREETAPAFRRFVETLYRPQLERLGWDVGEGDGSDEREKRARALTILG
ncbi:MAG: M1 family metallopeptidase, partial [Candidatus Limnocylindria bacterium]